MFEMISENGDFLKKFKDVCFSTFKSYSFDQVDKNLSEAKSIALRILTGKKRRQIKLQRLQKLGI